MCRLRSAPGETLSLVGESGAGKTTVAKMVLLLEQLSGGSCCFDGKDVGKFGRAELKEYRSNVQAVFQDPWGSMDPRMRVKTIVAEPLVVNTTLERKEIQRKVHGAAGAGRVCDRTRPSCIRTSSAAASGSASPSRVRWRSIRGWSCWTSRCRRWTCPIRAQIMNLLKDIQTAYGLSYLMIAHNLATVRYMSHAVAIMYLGKIVEYAEGDELFEQPLHPYTKALMSAALPTHPDEVTEEIVLSGEMPSPLNPPSGCHFHPRCPAAMDICREVAPQVIQIGESHTGELPPRTMEGHERTHGPRRSVSTRRTSRTDHWRGRRIWSSDRDAGSRRWARALFLTDLDGARLDETAEIVRAAGGTCATRTVIRALRRTSRRCLGTWTPSSARSTSWSTTPAATRCRAGPKVFPLDIWEGVLRTNLTGYFLYARGAGKRMIARGNGGAVVNVSSIASASSLGRGNLAYGASKSGVNQLTRELAVEWAHHGIRVNAIQPCQFLNAGWRSMVADPNRAGLVQRVLSGIPIGRMGEPHEIVGPVPFLVSDAASMVTGVLLPVDGGTWR